MLKEASNNLGVDYFELFTAMVTSRTYEDVMKTENKHKTKTRLGRPRT